MNEEETKKLEFARQLIEDSVESDPDIRGGRMVLKGSRFFVSTILAEIADGKENLRQIAGDYGQNLSKMKKFFEGMSILYEIRYSKLYSILDEEPDKKVREYLRPSEKDISKSIKDGHYPGNKLGFSSSHDFYKE